MIRKTVISALSVLLLGGCSYQWRDAVPDATPDQVASMLDEAQGGQGQTALSSDVGAAMQYRDQSVVFFGQAPSSLGPVPGFLSLMDFSFLGAGSGIWYGNIQQARVFFLDRHTDAGEDLGLVFGLDQGSGSFTYYGFSGQGRVDGGLFEAVLSGGAGQQIVVRSYDVQDDTLADIIQLKVYAADASGNEVYVGKISTLIGYGQ